MSKYYNYDVKKKTSSSVMFREMEICDTYQMKPLNCSLRKSRGPKTFDNVNKILVDDLLEYHRKKHFR